MNTRETPAASCFESARLHLKACPAGEEDIHQLRVACKQLRACLRLLPNSPERKTVDRSLRDLSRRFAGQRDIDVQRKTLLRLLPAGEAAESLLSELDLEKPTAMADTGSLQREALHELERIETLWQQLPMLSAQQLPAAFAEQYRQCKRLSDNALRGDDEQLHRWRMREKFLLYQCELIDHKKLHPLHRHLKKLADLLGKHHDLVVLESTLMNTGIQDKRQKTLRKRLLKAKRQLHQRICRQCRRSFKISNKKLRSWLQVE